MYKEEIRHLLAIDLATMLNFVFSIAIALYKI